jgi:hypothetical protein
MPIPFDRFRYLNDDPTKPNKLMNLGDYPAEYVRDDFPPQLLAPKDDVMIEGAKEIGVRRANEGDPPTQIAIVVES